MCCRTPSAWRLVQAALNASATSSTVFRGRTPLDHGLEVIRSSSSAKAGSHPEMLGRRGGQGLWGGFVRIQKSSVGFGSRGFFHWGLVNWVRPPRGREPRQPTIEEETTFAASNAD